MYIPDPIEIIESRVEKLNEQFIDENTCMGCGQKVTYELICPDPLGCGPGLCADCLPDLHEVAVEYYKE